VFTEILEPPDRIGDFQRILPPKRCPEFSSNSDPVEEQFPTRDGLREPESAVKVRYATSLPFGDPVGAVEAQTAQALNIGPSEVVPVTGRWWTVPKGKCDRIAPER